MHDHHHGKHHKHHSDDTKYHLQDDTLEVIFLDDYSPEVKGEISISHFHSGHGGQNVNKSNKGVHISFTPEEGGEKILASCIDERSEIQNRERALRSLIEKIRTTYKLDKPRKNTKIPRRSKEQRIADKKHNAEKKSQRKYLDASGF